MPPKPQRATPPLNRPQVRRLKKQKPGGIPPAPPMAPAEPTEAREHAALAPTRATSSAGREGAAASGANAAALTRWLTADTLRSQFILTEILQPPLALRERGPD